MAKVCSYAGCDRGCYGEFCLQHKPRKPIRKFGKVAQKWTETRHDWIKKHTNQSGTWNCYLCGKLLTLETLTLDHVLPKSGRPDLRYEFSNLKPCCWECNNIKGSKRL